MTCLHKTLIAALAALAATTSSLAFAQPGSSNKTNASAEMLSMVAAFGGPALALLVGFVYFYLAGASAPMTRRIAASAYAPVTSVVFLAAVFAWPDDLRYTEAGVHLYYALQTIPFVLLLYSLLAYPGAKATHIALGPIAALAWAWTFALGYWGVSGK